jgi:adenine C2-methylase RlmN of 23S rRNA A2503 and tRNA A37
MKPRILDLSHSELVELIGSLGEPQYRADQILKWIYGGTARAFDDMTDLPQAFRLKLNESCHLFTLEPVDERLSSDGQTRKVLFQLEDGKTIESAYILYEQTETSRERRTVCVSTQVGCSIRCPFCATGQQGFERSLTAGEIVEQVLYFVWLAQSGDHCEGSHHGVREDPPESPFAKGGSGVGRGAGDTLLPGLGVSPSVFDGGGGRGALRYALTRDRGQGVEGRLPGKPAKALKMNSGAVASRPAARRALTNVVFMGMGEPLANYEAVKGAIAKLNSKKGLGLGARQITVSTVGLVPQIRRLVKEDVHVELAVSLHAASDRVRSVLVPVNRRYPLRLLIPACQEYLEKTGRRPTFEYALFNGINDSLDQAQKLAGLLAGFDCHVNLIVGNPTPSKEFRPSVARRVAAFQKQLTEGGVSNTLRQSRGADIEAGCGQLRSRRLVK